MKVNNYSWTHQKHSLTLFDVEWGACRPLGRFFFPCLRIKTLKEKIWHRRLYFLNQRVKEGLTLFLRLHQALETTWKLYSDPSWFKHLLIPVCSEESHKPQQQVQTWALRQCFYAPLSTRTQQRKRSLKNRVRLYNPLLLSSLCFC